MSERDEAIALANRLLDQPNVDPDDDLRVLSRQLLRALEPTPDARADAEGPTLAGQLAERAIRAEQALYEWQHQVDDARADAEGAGYVRGLEEALAVLRGVAQPLEGWNTYGDESSMRLEVLRAVRQEVEARLAEARRGRAP